MSRNSLIIILLASLLLSGCWDARDIEERGFVLGVAVDTYPPIATGQEDPAEADEEKPLEVTPIDTGVPIYTYTVQLPIIRLARSPNQQGGGGDASTPKTWEITETGNSIFEMSRNLTSRTNTTIYYEHLQVIVISEAVARQGIHKVLDFFIRDPEMRSRTKVFITKGDAKAVLDVIPRIEDYSSIYLAKTTNNARLVAKLIHWTDLGKAAQFLYEKNDFLLPYVQVSKDEVKNMGEAVFREDKMVGWLSGSDVEANKLIRNLYEGGVLTSTLLPDNKGYVTLEITKAKTHITPVVTGDQITFQIDIDVVGNFVDATNFNEPGSFDQNDLDAAARAFEKSIKSQCELTLDKLKHELKVDVSRFGKILEAEKPEVWEQIKDDWRDVYPQTKAEISVKVSIKQMGNIR